MRIKVSAPGKIHLLGEHSVVYGKPALLATVDLRVIVALNPVSPVIARVQRTRSNLLNGEDYFGTKVPRNDEIKNLQRIIEPIVKNHLKIKSIPHYLLEISSQLPPGAGLGSSAAISAAFIAVLLSFLKVKWDKALLNKLTLEAEKTFHGNPSGADNATVIYGGLILYTKGAPIQPLRFSIPQRLAKNFLLINTGIPKETTKEMVELVRVKGSLREARKAERGKFKKIFDNQEQLVKKLLLAIQSSNENQLIQIIRAGEKNLENIGVVSSYAKSIIRQIEKAGGAAKICGAGGRTKNAGILLCYHFKPSIIEDIAKTLSLDYFKTTLGVEGIRQESLTKKI